MNTMTLTLENERATKAMAERFADKMFSPLIIGFSGHLGAGKTTFVRAMLQGMGITGPIKSPTYALLESYDCVKFTVHHFDLYRIATEDELELLGFRDCLTSRAICCIEWPENTRMSKQLLDIHCILRVEGDGRLLEISALTPQGKRLLDTMADR